VRVLKLVTERILKKAKCLPPIGQTKLNGKDMAYGKKMSGKASSMKSKCAKCKMGSKCKCKKK